MHSPCNSKQICSVELPAPTVSVKMFWNSVLLHSPWKQALDMANSSVAYKKEELSLGGPKRKFCKCIYERMQIININQCRKEIWQKYLWTSNFCGLCRHGSDVDNFPNNIQKKLSKGKEKNGLMCDCMPITILNWVRLLAVPEIFFYLHRQLFSPLSLIELTPSSVTLTR